MDVSQILPNLFVGSFPKNTENIDGLRREKGVTAVLNVQTDDDMARWGVNWYRLEPDDREAGIEVRQVPVWELHRLPAASCPSASKCWTNC